MILYLTSSPTGSYRSSRKDFEGLDPSNGMVEELRKDWKENMNVLLISAFPDNYELNDEMCRSMRDEFIKTGLSVNRFEVCDMRNECTILKEIEAFGFVILGGGHVPTENAFFAKIGLKTLLSNFNGIVMGISAGSMNCAEEVYAQPELEGESEDPAYRRFIQGLALTKCSVIPHYQAIKDDVLDGKNVITDIALPDSHGRKFIVLVDGSYILKRGSAPEELHGEGYLIQDGMMTQICDRDQCIILSE